MSPAARAGAIFGIGVAAVAVIIAALWLIRRRMRNSSGDGATAQRFGCNVADADAELVQTLFTTL